jgi:hypothetical protein
MSMIFDYATNNRPDLSAATAAYVAVGGPIIDKRSLAR